MIRTSPVRPYGMMIAIAVCALGAGSALADDTSQIVVEAKAPVHKMQTSTGQPGGDRVDLLSVSYHVHMTGLDLSKHGDVLQAQEQVKAAAKKGCAAIQKDYPVDAMSDVRQCESEATARGMAQLDKLVAAAGKAK